MSESGSARYARRSTAEWRALLKRLDQSGLSAAAFCRREGLCSSSLYRWRRQLSESPAEQELRDQDVESGAFVDLGPLTGAGRLELKLDLGGGILLHLVRG
ncbi:MAG: transposase [Rhodocyclaceae bacterium]|nr:transposase [Rhodocyclaceae bacterium]